MPISVEDFEEGNSAEDRMKPVLDMAVRVTHYMLEKENAPTPVDVFYGKGFKTYHWYRKGKHIIKYGAGNFESAKNSLIYIVSKGEVYKVSSKHYPREIHHLALIIEETAHYFQDLEEGGRTYGSVHNGIFIQKHHYLWDKYSDYVMEEVRQAIKECGLE